MIENTSLQIATFAGGCFWCTEAVFKRLKGIVDVVPGYAGGKGPRPTYNKIHAENTGYVEAVQITFDPITIPYMTLLDVFWATHNPTTLDRQDYDEGPEYRSIIFYHNTHQKNQAHASKEALEKEGRYKNPIVTQIVSYTNFYPAESEHKDYYEKNHETTYCRIIIDPKIQKLMKQFKDVIKNEYKTSL